jgi:phosphatidylinositol phospholipase C delta
MSVDIYDGDHEPVVYHGKTLTSKVALRDICNAIAKYAFVTSPYPVLISAEVHCGVAQQDILVDIMTEVFGDAIVQAPLEGRPKIEKLPSPAELTGKFLLKVSILSQVYDRSRSNGADIKAKNLYVAEQLAAAQAVRLAAKAAELKPVAAIPASTSSDETSDNEAEVLLKEGVADLKKTWKKLRGAAAPDEAATKDDAKNKPKPKPKPKMSFKLTSLLVYTVGVKCNGIAPDIEYAPEHIFSLSENSVNRLMRACVRDLVTHTHTHLVRIYPKGTRVNSTNYEPHRYWAAGCQVTAINWQTFGAWMQILDRRQYIGTDG